ncbi:MAG: hypothetical protein ACE5IB_03800 [Candidatus Geothermarchaeales archaeon]
MAEPAIVASGLLVVYQALRGYNRSPNGSFFFLSLGFGLITLGSVVKGILFEFYFIGLLEGDGKDMRRVKIRSLEDVKTDAFTTWVQEAVALNED